MTLHDPRMSHSAAFLGALAVYAGLRKRRQSEGLHRVTIRVLRHKGRGSTLSRLGNSSMRRVPNSAMRLEQQSAEKPAQVPVEVFECSSLRMESAQCGRAYLAAAGTPERAACVKDS